MSIDVDLTGLPDDVARSVDRRPGNPQGWEPGIVWDGRDVGTLTTPALTEPVGDDSHDWDAILGKLGLDAGTFTVVPPVQVSYDPAAWHRDEQGQDAVTRPVWRYKARVVRRRCAVGTAVDYDGLVDEIRDWKPTGRTPPAGDWAMLVNLADWQIGSADGRGTKAIVARVLRMIDEISHRITALRAMGYRIGRMHVEGLGDLFEGCTGHYAMQEFTVELDRREQTRVIRRLIKGALTAWINRVEIITVGTVPGNHGEHRKDGKAFTTFGDNDDVAVFEAIAEMFAENPELRERVFFSIPDAEPVQVFDINGVDVAFTHSHLATKNRNGGKLPPAQGKVLTWWKDQNFGEVFEGLSSAQLLITGHYHHYSCIEHGSKVHFQCPAMDDGSIWFTNQSGYQSRSGTLTMLLKDGCYEAVEIVGSGSREPVAA